MSDEHNSDVDIEALAERASIDPSTIPTWENAYLDRVANRLMFNYDLQQDTHVEGHTFNLTAEMRIESKKHFFHPSLRYANHEAHEYIFVQQHQAPSVAYFKRLVELGHELADKQEYLDPDEEHFGTDFTFVVIANLIENAVDEFVGDFRDRTLLKFGYYGHYEINLIVVAPDDEIATASKKAESVAAFALWRDMDGQNSDGILSRVRSQLGI